MAHDVVELAIEHARHDVLAEEGVAHSQDDRLRELSHMTPVMRACYDIAYAFEKARLRRE